MEIQKVLNSTFPDIEVGWGIYEVDLHEAQHIKEFRGWFSDHPKSFKPKPKFWSLVTHDNKKFYAAVEINNWNTDGVPCSLSDFGLYNSEVAEMFEPEATDSEVDALFDAI